MIVPTASVSVFLQDTRLRIIGITAQKHSNLLPNVPTISESGMPGFLFESWFGLLAPRATPPEAIAKINAAVNKVIAIKEVNDRLQNLGIETAYLNVEGFNKLFLADRDLMTKIVKDSGITRE